MALLPCIVGEPDGLRRIGAGVELQRDIWLLSHRDAGSIARFKAVAAWLTQLYASNQHLLCGAADATPSVADDFVGRISAA